MTTSMSSLPRKGMSAFVLTAALVLSACGGDSDSHDDYSEAPAPKTQPDPIANTVAADAAAPGTYAVAEEEYNFGRMTVYDNKNGDSYDTDIHGYIQYPDEAAGPFPVVLFLHGRHGTCYDGRGIDDDDCANPIPSFRGYEYISRNLVSHGYAVISVDANDINDHDSGPSNGDTGGLARSMLVVRHLDEFRTINAAGGQGLDALIGKLDMSEIGIMGHSRGGEGVNQTVLYNRAQPEPHNITAVFSLAPTDYNTQTVSRVNFVALAGYCDGDVEDLMGNFAYDTSRYAVANDPYPKFQLIPMGANHNYYNTVWTSDTRPDDWTILDGNGDDPWCGENAAGNGRDTPELQQAQGLFFIASFFRYFIGHEQAFGAYWNGRTPVPGALCPDGQGPCDDRYLLSVHAPAADRLVIDDTLDAASLTTNNLGGSVWFDGFSSYGICQTNGRPGEGCDVAAPTFNIAEQLFMAWDTTATYRSELLGLNATDYQVLSVRVGISHGDPDNQGGQDFHVALRDRDGNRVAVLASDYGDGLFYPPGRPFHDANNGAQKTTLNAVDIPLTAFEGVDFTRLDAVELSFDATSAGTVQITDLVMQRVDF